MSNKERLEEIKGRALRERCTFTVGDGSSREGYRYILSDEDYRWLKEQAERVGELEKDLDEWRNEVIKVFKRFEEYQERYLETKEVLHSIVSENKRLREALEEISNADWNSEGLDAERELDRVTDIAFKALEGE